MLVYCPSDWPCRLADFTIAAQPLSTVKQYEETRALTIGCVTSIANSKRGHIQKVSRGQSILWTSGSEDAKNAAGDPGGPPAALDAHGREGVLPRRIPPANVP